MNWTKETHYTKDFIFCKQYGLWENGWAYAAIKFYDKDKINHKTNHKEVKFPETGILEKMYLNGMKKELDGRCKEKTNVPVIKETVL